MPEHWQVKRLKDILPKITTGGTPTEELFVESGFKWYTPGDFNENLFLTKSRKEVIGKPNVKIYPENSILIVSIGATLGKIGITKECFSANQQINVVYPSRLYLTLYIANFLSASTATIRASANASTIGIMNQSKTGQILVCVPPLSEQRAIADYLDTKTAQIDRKIDLLSQKAKLYSNLKQSLINETVTRGLDKSVPMKDSEYEWDQEIPKHWQETRVKNIFKLITDLAPNNNNFELLSLYVSIGVRPIKDMEQRGNKSVTTDGYWLVKKGDIIVNKLFAWWFLLVYLNTMV